MIAYDLETHLVQPGLLAPPIVCGSFAHRARGIVETCLTLSPVEELEAWLNTSKAIAGANIAFDFGCILAQKPELLPLVWRKYEEGKVHDVQHVASLHAIAEGRLHDGGLFDKKGSPMVDPSSGKITNRFSLAVCVKEWLGRSDAKVNDRWRLSYSLLDGLRLMDWPEDARRYPEDDARNTLEVAEAQLAAPALNLHNAPAQSFAAFCMHLGAMWGIQTDPVRVEKWGSDLLKQQEELKQKFLEHGFYRVEKRKGEEVLVKDTKVLKARVEKAYLGNPPLTETQKTSCDRVTLEESGDEVLVEFASVSKTDKLVTYAKALLAARGTPFNVQANPILATGRSSYEGLIQLMPRKGGARENFVARQGCVLSSVDYSAVELSTLAQVCLWVVGWSKLADAINAGVDPHALFAAKMIGREYAEVLPLAKKKGTKEADYRQAGKAANFGFPGMMGAAKFVVAKRKEGLKVCELFHRDGRCGEEKVLMWHDRPTDYPLCTRCLTESERLKKFYSKEMWLEMREYWAWVSSRLEYDDKLTQFVSKRIRGGLNGPSGANTMFQGLAADGAKAALVALTKEMYLDTASPLYGSRLLVFAHDETILEIPEEKAHEAAHRQADIMVREMKRFVPDVKISAEPALMRRWYKDAEAVFENGRLVPWEPKPTT